MMLIIHVDLVRVLTSARYLGTFLKSTIILL